MRGFGRTALILNLPLANQLYQRLIRTRLERAANCWDVAFSNRTPGSKIKRRRCGKWYNIG